MYIHYRRKHKRLSLETKIIVIFLLVSAALGAWIPYFFAQFSLH
ncbi:MAG TPA: hypothetical protein VK900_02820 [Anaerolineales bacterium]|nr:hypothetical protein [Anaerolineales bacterium]